MIHQLKNELSRLAALPASCGMSLTPDFYTSEGWIALERKHLFRREWICVGRADELPNVGDYRAAEIDGVPLVIVRRKDGQLAVMSAVCRHRMATIASGCGNSSGFTCPYHGWTYDLEGRLITAPRMSAAFDRGTIRLPQFPAEEWNGFVYVSLDAQAQPLAQRLGELTSILAPYHVERMRTIKREQHVWRTNWKALVENFLEPYHLNVTHRATLAEFAGPEGVTILPPGTIHQFHRHRMKEHAQPLPLDARIGIPNEDVDEEAKRTAYIGVIFPTHLLSVTWDSAFWLSLQPHGVDEVLVDVGLAGPFKLPSGEVPDPRHPNLYYMDLIDAVNAEDRVQVEAVQRGARSGFALQGPLHPHEAPLVGFFAYLHAQLGKADVA